MLIYTRRKWAENEARLEKAIREIKGPEHISYEDLLELCIQHILNDGEDVDSDESTSYEYWNTNIHTIDDGDYQGTLLFLFHRKCYQPSYDNYLMTYVGYGSCSACDVLQEALFNLVIYNVDEKEMAKELEEKKSQREEGYKILMKICRDLMVNTKKPFSYRGNDKGTEFEEYEYPKSTEAVSFNPVLEF